MKQILCLLSLLAVTYAQKGRGIKIRSDSARIAFGKKQDVLIARKPDGGLLLKAKYVEVSALRVSGKSLSDYIVMTAKTRFKQICPKCGNGGSGGKTTKKKKTTKKAPLKCGSGSAKNCKVVTISTPKYSAGNILRIHNGKRVRKSTETDSCPTGYKIFSPRNKNDWTIVYNAMKKNINNYPKKPHFIVDVTRPANGCGGCTKYAMKSTTAQQGSWRTKAAALGGCEMPSTTSRTATTTPTATCTSTM
jgi:hypothetical protein